MKSYNIPLEVRERMKKALAELVAAQEQALEADPEIADDLEWCDWQEIYGYLGILRRIAGEGKVS